MNQDNENKSIESESVDPASGAVTDTPEPQPTPESKGTENVRAGQTNSVADWFVRFGKAAWHYIKHARTELIVLAAILAVDLLTKALVAKFMTVGQSITVLPDFLYITYVQNTKAAFGSAFGLEKVLGDDAIRIIFLIITVLALGVFCYLLYRLRKRHLLMRLSIAMIIAGALGNFFDRLILHYVRDFVEIVFFGCKLPLLGETFPVFNVADMGLTIGVILFLVYFIAIYKEPKVKPAVADADTEPVTEKEKDAAVESEESERAHTEESAEEATGASQEKDA